MVSRSMGVVLCVVAMTAGCNVFKGGVVEDVTSPKRTGEGSRIAGNDGTILDGLSLRNTIMGDAGDENRLPVNKYLWRASLDVLSFLPLASVDTFSGVIATDWGASPGAANERVRVTTYVRDADLTATALDVSVFRETLTPGGVWQTATVDPATAEQLENAILTRARQLRIEDIDS